MIGCAASEVVFYLRGFHLTEGQGVGLARQNSTLDSTANAGSVGLCQRSAAHPNFGQGDYAAICRAPAGSEGSAASTLESRPGAGALQGALVIA